jgi:alpha-beta hydrolase superfamily lysophospholipase
MTDAVDLTSTPDAGQPPTAQFTYPAGDGLEIHAYRWDTDGPVRGVVQITHGMGEHALRYGHLAATLTAAGFAVYAQDHRGHGATGTPGGGEQGAIGADGWAALVDDVDRLVTHARREHPGVPLVLLGHSMGSFAVQQYLLDHSDRVDAVVLTGTALLDLLEPAMDLDREMDLSAFNAAFAPARTDYDWLSRDEAQVDAYVADPHCGFGLDGPAVRGMFTAARELADAERMAGVRADLPLYVAVGAEDPVNGQLALAHALLDRYRAAGLADVTFHAYEGARHEVFNETNRDEVEADLLAWLDQVVPAR